MAAAEPLHVVLRTRRKELGLSQTRLAADVGVSQPAVSKFEAGRPGALSREHIEAVARRLGVDLAELEARRPARLAAAERLFFCPNAYCPSNVPHVVGGELRFFPRTVRSSAERVRCAFCGDVMSGWCPHCGAEVVTPGAYCTAPECGRPLVEAAGVAEEDGDLAGWAAARRAETAELLWLLQPQGRPSQRSDRGIADRAGPRA